MPVTSTKTPKSSTRRTRPSTTDPTAISASDTAAVGAAGSLVRRLISSLMQSTYVNRQALFLVHEGLQRVPWTRCSSNMVPGQLFGSNWTRLNTARYRPSLPAALLGGDASAHVLADGKLLGRSLNVAVCQVRQLDVRGGAAPQRHKGARLVDARHIAVHLHIRMRGGQGASHCCSCSAAQQTVLPGWLTLSPTSGCRGLPPAPGPAAAPDASFLPATAPPSDARRLSRSAAAPLPLAPVAAAVPSAVSNGSSTQPRTMVPALIPVNMEQQNTF
jgi:hypothetical protein